MADFDADHANRRNRMIGMTLVLASAVAWSGMGLFVRMMPDADVWTIVFWRSIFGGLSILALAMIERRTTAIAWRRTLTPAGIAITLFIASGIFAAIYSMQNTTIANGCVIYATAPFMAAALAWLWFREKPGTRTIGCTIVALFGVVLTVSGTIADGGGKLDGDIAMVYATFSLAMITVIMRRHRDTPMLESVAIACFVAALFSYFVADPLAVSPTDIGLLAIFGVITQGGGLGLYTMGARRLPSAQAALLSAAEVPMSPLWVWIFFDEMPATETFVGAAFVLAAVFWSIAMDLRADGKPAIAKSTT